MPLSADTLRMHLDYTAWASSRLVEAASKLSPEELTRDFQTADHSVLGTLVHCFAADRVWMARIEGNTSQKFLDAEKDMHLSVLQNDWPALLGRWKEWAANQSDASLLEPAVYKDLKGNEYRTPLWQIGLHVVNHATHHRGQASGFLRSMGKVPPPLDLMAYYRGLSKS